MKSRIHAIKLQPPFQAKRWLRLALLAVVGWMITVGCHIGRVTAAPSQEIAPAEMQRPVVDRVDHAADLVRRGKTLHQAGQFSEAIAVWQEAAVAFETQRDFSNQAVALTHLASTLESLGRWAEANQAIQQAIALLKSSQLNRQPNTASILAQALNTQGILQLAQGQESAALETWQQAEAVYRTANDTVGMLGSQMNQARALQALGFYRRAIVLSQQVEQTLQAQPDSALKLAGLRNLGSVLQAIGDLKQSRALLQQSLTIAQKLQQERQMPEAEATLTISRIWLSLGNTARAQGDIDTALTFYRQAAAMRSSSPTGVIASPSTIQAQVLQLSLLTQVERWAEAQTLWNQIQLRLPELLPGRANIYTRIHLAQALMKLGQQAGNKGGSGNQAAAQVLATAVEQARTLSDRRAESYALGKLGHLYEQTQQWEAARSLTQQALILAQSFPAPDIAYQWQWQLGRLLAVQEGSNRASVKAVNADSSLQPDKQPYKTAIAAYTDAFNTLQTLRGELVAIPDVQFSFRESVEPLYRQFVELLLRSDQDDQPGQNNLKQARQVIESLQLAELDNYFREACLDARPVQIDQIDAEAAVIYPIILRDQLAVILSLPGQPLRYYQTARSQVEIERTLDQMQQSLRETAFPEERLPIAQRVYELLIQPVEATLAASSVKTLVFVLDGALRNIPMSALYDGQQYLIEKYNIALAPSLQLLQPQPLKRLPLQGLLGGLSQARQGFSALPNVEFEVSQIKSKVPAQVLLDQTFTSTTFQSRVDTTPFPIVHLATHGQFSSNVDETFILTWDNRITVKQLDQLLQTREGEQRPIELLVLSACETAAGDRRAALGMAGFAVRSGARSTLATLWSVNDRSTALLMTEFYRTITQPEVTKAEALRRAQLALLKQPEYENPYYWAPFILLGNWL